MRYDDTITRALNAADKCLEHVENAGPSTPQQAAAWAQVGTQCAQVAAQLDAAQMALAAREPVGGGAE